MSKADVDELLKDIEEQLISIKKYKKITKVKLKSILENLRSSLEYMAHCPKKGKGYISHMEIL